MKRALMFLFLTLPLTVTGQNNPVEPGGTIWFYYPEETPSPLGSPRILDVGGVLTRSLAKIAPGQYFGYPVAPGIHIFSFTRAPSRNEVLAVAIKSGQEAYVEVHFRKLILISSEDGKRAVEQSDPIPDLSVLDRSVTFVGSPPVTKPPVLVASVVGNDNRGIRPNPPTTLLLPPQSGTPPRPRLSPPQTETTSAIIPAFLPESAAAPAMPARLDLAALSAQAAAAAIPAAPKEVSPPKSVPQPQKETPAPAAATSQPTAEKPAPAAATSQPTGGKPAPPASALPPQREVTTPAVAAALTPRPNLPRQFVNTPEAFAGATVNTQIDGKKREIDAVVTFDKDMLVVTEKRNRGVLKIFTYTNIKGAEYSYSRSPQWKTAIPLNLSMLSTNTGPMKHWFLVFSSNDYSVVELDKENFNLVLAAFELRTGRKVEIAEDKK